MFNFTRRDGKRIVEPGEFELQGASSADIRDVVTVNVTGETRCCLLNGVHAKHLSGSARVARIKKKPIVEMGKDYTQQFVVSLRGFHAYNQGVDL